MSLSQSERKWFRSIGHNLNPIVSIAGNGLSENVMAEIHRALNDHELIKIKLAIPDRQAKASLIEQVCIKTGAELIQTIGHIALIYKPAKKPNPKLTNLKKL